MREKHLVAWWLVRPVLGILLAWVGGSLAAQSKAQEPDFSGEIAPLLAKHCLECHSSTEAAGGLNLATAESALAGGQSGPAIDPLDWSAGLVWQMIDAGEMPKNRPPLVDHERVLLQRWLQAGGRWEGPAIDPLAYSSERRAGYDWWSLQPVRRPTPPAVDQLPWISNEIDLFVLHKIEQVGLIPSPPADRRTLIRRLSFDLLGLPPTPAEVEAFVHDPRNDAYEQLVERLLASPHYGERWARHWLDVVRFGETQGYERNRIREHAWRYRDWVVRAFNQDLPYDQFVRWQIAGDVLEPDNFDAWMATGYHVCGTWDQVGHLEGSPVMRAAARWEHLEDLVGTLGQAFLGLTVNCSRCHDHKYDPISQTEYYQLAAALGGVHQGERERTGIAVQPVLPQREAWQKELSDLQRRLAELQAIWIARAPSHRADSASGIDPLVAGQDRLLMLAKSAQGHLADLEFYRLSTGGEVSRVTGEPISSRGDVKVPAEVASEWTRAIKASGQFSVEVWLESERPQQSGPARIVTLSLDSGARNFTLGQDGQRLDVRLRTTTTDSNGMPSFGSAPLEWPNRPLHVVLTCDPSGKATLYLDGHEVGQKTVGGTLANWDEGFSLAVGNEVTGDRPWLGKVHGLAIYARALSGEEIRQQANSSDPQSLGNVGRWQQVLAHATPAERAEYHELRDQCQELEQRLVAQRFDGSAHVIIPQQPPVYHVLQRGDPSLPGQVVVPRGLAALSLGGLEADFALSSEAPEAERRVALAGWLTDPRNPLTARVIVNRLWQHHFGRGIVDTPSDFGFSGGRPSHPELLDWLADELVRQGWSLKALHRCMVLSATYRQSSTQHPNPTQALAVDAENRWLWRANRRRLESEAIRDAALFVAGELNLRIGGPSFLDMQVKRENNAEFTDPDDAFNPEVNRRTLYRLWARSGHHPLLQAFDCPEPSVMAPTRSHTITPIQAMQLLNNTRMEQIGRQWAQHLEQECGPDVHARLRRAWQQAYAREPSTDEIGVAEVFVAAHGWEQLCLVLLNTNEFIFLN